MSRACRVDLTGRDENGGPFQGRRQLPVRSTQLTATVPYDDRRPHLSPLHHDHTVRRATANILAGIAVGLQILSMLAFLGYPPDWLDRHWAFYRNLVDNAPVKAEQQHAVAERIAALLTFDRSADLHTIKLSTLIQGAEDDLIVPGFLQHELHALMPGSALSMMANGGHLFPVSRPEAFVRAIDCHAERIGLLRC